VERCSTSAYSYLAFDGLISGLQAGAALGEKQVNELAEFGNFAFESGETFEWGLGHGSIRPRHMAAPSDRGAGR
jgi:hypothetical protein